MAHQTFEAEARRQGRVMMRRHWFFVGPVLLSLVVAVAATGFGPTEGTRIAIVLLCGLKDRRSAASGSGRVIASRCPGSNAGIPGIAPVVRIRGAQSFADVLHAVGHGDSGQVLPALVAELAGNA